jgi:RHS repeat-associated protein
MCSALAQAFSAGFDSDSHEIHERSNGDLWLKPLGPESSWLIIASEVSIPLEVYDRGPRNILLLRNSDGSYSVVHNPTEAQLGSGWVASTRKLVVDNLNSDGNNDLIIRAAQTNDSTILINAGGSNAAPVVARVIKGAELGLDISQQSEYQITFTNGDIRAQKGESPFLIARYNSSNGSYGTFEGRTRGLSSDEVSAITASLTGEYLPAIKVTNRGGAQAVFNIDMPPGIGNIAPKLGITYSSRVGNSILGNRFVLHGISVISRCPKNRATDGVNKNVTYTDADALCMDGQRLIPLTSGNPISNGMEFRTEVDSFTKVVLGISAGKKTFTAWLKNGNILTFSEAQYSQGRTPRVDIAWHLSKVADRFGNEANYIYTDAGTSGVLLHRINFDSGSVVLGYQSLERLDTVDQYPNGNHQKQDKKLNIISTYVTKNNIYTPLAEYRFIYHASQIFQDSQPVAIRPDNSFSNLIRLDKIQKCVFDLNGQNSKACLTPTEFTWSENSYNFMVSTNSSATETVRDQTLVVDYNNDGRQDLIVVSGREIKVHLSNASGDLQEATLLYTAPEGRKAKSVSAADLDWDGLPDLLIRESQGPSLVDKMHRWVILYNGENSASTILDDFNWGHDSRYATIIDVTGDGYSDLLLPQGKGTWNLYTNEKDRSFAKSTEVVEISDDVKGITYLGNVTGEYHFLSENENKTLTTFKITPALQKADGITVANNIDIFIPIDANGDGLVDILTPDGNLLRLYTNEGGSFSSMGRHYSSSSSVFSEYRGSYTYRDYPVKVVDLDQDGNQELVAVRAGKIKQYEIYPSSIGIGWRELTSFDGVTNGSPGDIFKSAGINLSEQCKKNSSGYFEDAKYETSYSTDSVTLMPVVDSTTRNRLIERSELPSNEFIGQSFSSDWAIVSKIDEVIFEFRKEESNLHFPSLELSETEISHLQTHGTINDTTRAKINELFGGSSGAALRAKYANATVAELRTVVQNNVALISVVDTFYKKLKMVSQTPGCVISPTQISKLDGEMSRLNALKQILLRFYSYPTSYNSYVDGIENSPYFTKVTNVAIALLLNEIVVQAKESLISNLVNPEVVDVFGVSSNGRGAFDYQFADTDGDGDLDIIKQRTAGANRWVVDKNQNATPEVVTGFHTPYQKITVGYSTLADSAVHEQKTLPASLIPFNRALPVVKQIRRSVNSGKSATNYLQSYKYKGMALDKAGRGLVGPMNIEITDSATRLITDTQYKQNFPYIGLPEQITQKSSSTGNTILKQVVTTWNSMNSASDRVFPYVENKTTTLNEVDGTTYAVTKEEYTYDAYGNVDLYKKSEAGSAAAITSSPEFVYTEDPAYNLSGNNNDVSKWLISFADSKTQTWQSSNNGENLTDRDTANVVRTTTFTAQPGTLAVHTAERFTPTHAQYLKTTNGYDSYGNLTTELVEGTGINSRTTTYSSFKNNRWATRVEHSQLPGKYRYFDYDVRNGQITSERGYDSNHAATAAYDQLGRKKYSLDKYGVKTDYAYQACTNVNECVVTAGSNEAAYYTQVTSPAMPDSFTYFDGFGREIKNRVQGFKANEWVNTVKEFDSIGRLVKESAPSLTNSHSYVQYSGFDKYNRPGNVDYQGVETVETGYAVVSGKREVTTTVTRNEHKQNSLTGRSLQSIRTDRFNSAGDIIKSIQAKDSDNQVVTYYDYNPLKKLAWSKVISHASATTIGSSGVVTAMKFDVMGNRVRLKDADAGVITNGYSALGEVITTTDAKNQVTTNQYDAMGRITSRTEAGDVTNWYYDNATQCQLDNALSEVRSPDSSLCAVSFANDSYTKLLGYNTRGDQVIIRETLSAAELGSNKKNSYLTEFKLDSFGRSAGMSFNSKVSYSNKYSATGYLEKQVNTADESKVYWQATDYDAFSNASAVTLSGNINQNITRNQIGNIDTLTAKVGSTSLQDESYSWFGRTTLGERKWSAGTAGKETYLYDELVRLKSASGVNGSYAYTYDKLGNIETKTGVTGTFKYGENGHGPHALTSAGGISYGYDDNGNMTERGSDRFVYNAFNKPTSITAGGKTSYFRYSPERGRYAHKKGNKVTYYAAGGLYEEIYDLSNKTAPAEINHYIGKNLIIERKGSVDRELYQLRDHQGSLAALAGANGTLIERFSYQPFGKRKTGGGNNVTRGYTDHEHLDESGLIHMNGRVYDPVIGRFLSADLFIQAPYNSQSYNRYSYVWNSPMSLVDPSGYEVSPGYFNEGLIPKASFSSDSQLLEGMMYFPVAAQNIISSSLNAPLNVLGAFGDAVAPYEGAAFSASQALAPAGPVGMAGMAGTRLSFMGVRGLGLLNNYRRVVPDTNASVIDDLVTIDRHGTLKRNQTIPGQSHHLNQNAAFKSVIPENEAVAVKLEGNAITEIGSPHYNAHESLESFWQPYRRGGDLHPTVPTNKEYTRALHQSLLDSGMSDANAWHATKAAMKQRVEYGLKGIDEVPRVPQRMGQKHRQ